MAKINIKFHTILEDYEIDSISRHCGPLFRKWLPNGQEDSVVLSTDDSKAQLRIWFERRGFVDTHFIQFDYKRMEVDESVMRRQAILDAGPLTGLLTLDEVTDLQVLALTENRIGDDPYVALAKRIVKIIQPPVTNFIQILRTQYGQYWLRPLEPWDSRTASIGNYCAGILQMSWSTDETQWSRFIPENQSISRVLEFRKNSDQYLDQADWQEISMMAGEGTVTASVALVILGRAHQLLDQGNIKHAIVEGVTALEVAISERIRRKAASLEVYLQRFWDLPLTAQLALVIVELSISATDTELAIEVIKMRHKIVHEGYLPSEEARGKTHALFRIVAALLPNPRVKFPSDTWANGLDPLEEKL